MNRRRYLAGLGALGAGSLAGCRSMFETRSARSPPLVEDRPDAVYVPSHVEGMEMVGMKSAGRARIALSYSFPHRFWLVDGTDTNKVTIQGEDSVHLMVSAWDGETGTGIPSANPSVTATKDGETVLDDRSPWRMISQNMGTHYGDNVALDGEGTYDVEVAFGPLPTRRTGAFEGAFAERSTLSFSLEFDRSTLEAISFERLDDRKGQRAALAPMEMEMMPIPQLPPREEYPGTVLGLGRSGDAKFLVSALDAPPAGVDASGPYLAVSPRTPYNRYPLPFMSLSATLSRGSETVFDGSLTPTLDPALKFHYGASVESVESGDSLTVSIQSPPQMSRHEGFETAFIDMAPVELTLES